MKIELSNKEVKEKYLDHKYVQKHEGIYRVIDTNSFIINIDNCLFWSLDGTNMCKHDNSMMNGECKFKRVNKNLTLYFEGNNENG